MPGIGDTLREARMRQGLDISDVETKTKIRAKYLRALENEEFSMLPGATFVRTFLRTYAEQLGLDPHRLVEEYRAGHEPREEPEGGSLGRPVAMRDRDRRPRRGPPFGPWAIIGLVVVAVIALLVVLGITGDDEPNDTASSSDTTPRPKTTATKPKPKPAAPKSVTLRVVPTGDTYVCVDRGQGTPVLFEGILAEPRTFRGKRVRLNLGRTSVQLRANGRNVAVPGGSNPVGFEFTPRRTRSLPLGERPCA
jgi:cytoskeleton protein RodZ